MNDKRQHIQDALGEFESGSLRKASLALLQTLGYKSEKTLDLDGSPDAFVEQFDNSPDQPFNKDKALFDDWKSVEFLFQLTDEELAGQASLFETNEVNTGLMQSYLFFAVELAGDNYARGKLTNLTRQINRLFPTPVMVFIKHLSDKQPVLSIAVMNRRQNKRDAARDVLGKVTIIRNISLSEPHRGHLDILSSFATENLVHPQRLPINSFDALHAAWEEIFNVELLNKRFYRELANWYFWALPQIDFPADTEPDNEKRRATSLIRLLTRLMFCWFLKEKGLIPEKLFNTAELKDVLSDLNDDTCTYHQGILQNLFFATLNQRMGKDSKGEPYRRYVTEKDFQGKNKEHGITNLYRYPEHFKSPDDAPSLFADIPFLNGGLFECLDREDPDNNNKMLRIDGFTTRGQRPVVPNELFFSGEQKVDLSDAYGETKKKNERVRGLLNILNSYKFTIVENTPIDQEIALDPELLGKVFENLLASYNEETKTTARKQTGSFYTPRPIVDYMVDECLKAHLTSKLVAAGYKDDDTLAEGLDRLLGYTEKEHPFVDEGAVDTLLDAIHTCKILDPACGSGAFPMGMLHKLVYIIHKLDPDNEKWKQLQIDQAGNISNLSSREAAIAAIERDFEDNEDDYGRKLYLIENCLYGVDIQPIAIQISKLRFFISLVCDQKTNRNKKDNHGIRPLPNLETKFVAANTLIGLVQDKQMELFASSKVRKLESELQRIRHDHFAATTRQKKLALQKRDRELRNELATELAQSTFADQETSHKLAAWDPYDPQQSADFFEPLWMFDQSLAEGFDVVLGNPPYIQIQKFPKAQKDKWIAQEYKTYAATADIYCLFYEKGAKLLKDGGHLCYITSNKWMRAGYGKHLRDFFTTTNINEVVDFGGVVVFASVVVDTAILRLSNDENGNSFPSTFIARSFNFSQSLPEYIRDNMITFNIPADSTTPWVVVSPERHQIKKQVEALGIPLEKWDLNINYGIKTGLNDAFYLTQEQRDEIITREPQAEEIIVPLLRGRYVERYGTSWDGTWMLFIPWNFPLHKDAAAKSCSDQAEAEFQRSYPVVYDYISAYKDKLSRRNKAETGIRYQWYCLQRWAANYHQEFRKPKIIYPNMTKYLPFYYDEQDRFFINDKAFIMTSGVDHLPYLAALLNSTLFRCCFMDNFPNLGEDRRELRKIFFEKIPIRKPLNGEPVVFEALVSLVQFSKRDNRDTASSQFLEDLIDACVMELYFRDHMAERDLLFLEELAPHLEKFDPQASEAKQLDYLKNLHNTLNAPSSKIRNRLLRITADSPDLLAVIKEEGKV
ncbi:MAG: hypothetical protein EOM12_05285 [Verrucomicrobiae bacterium]|nr:hypothetical protein [Verrucomicrobiae bacterium]